MTNPEFASVLKVVFLSNYFGIPTWIQIVVNIKRRRCNARRQLND